jgi:hypothetical protein
MKLSVLPVHSIWVIAQQNPASSRGGGDRDDRAALGAGFEPGRGAVQPSLG